ncbi:transglutaminase-like domain-containing protein [Nannocystis sp.]|uniref:SirB1 family protein n=1 Tax=Nannocystis sp. TaxID=1962667 RepID=UPI0024275E2D|nr:transglutaminase-like domain-containing protein [Nannocystis sp.]MBK7825385.1 transglutaminase family protein [Nannocystis sp.]MBK9757035.1 transglutaminase family protein [Nannocystis sp.]
MLDAATERLRARFMALAAAPDEALDLGELAAVIGVEEDPTEEVDEVLERLERLAEGVAPRLRGFASARERVDLLLAYLVREQGLHGDEAEYDDPRNSCLHQVLRRRVGLPIMLSVVLMEVGLRVGLPVVGVGLPAHFLAHATELPEVYIDMFHGGRLLSEHECRTLLRQKTQGAVEFERSMLSPLSSRQILLRILQNLKRSHLRRGALDRALAASDRILLLAPGQVDELRDRGLLQLRRRAFRAASEDLNNYLSLAPMADDRHLIAARASEARTRVRQLN